MPKKVSTSERTVQRELAAIATVLRQINRRLDELITVDEEAEEREREFRTMQGRPIMQPQYLNGRWKNQDGNTYHPLDEKGGALEEEQRKYQASLNETTEWSQSVTGRNTDPE